MKQLRTPHLILLRAIFVEFLPRAAANVLPRYRSAVELRDRILFYSIVEVSGFEHESARPDPDNYFTDRTNILQVAGVDKSAWLFNIAFMSISERQGGNVSLADEVVDTMVRVLF